MRRRKSDVKLIVFALLAGIFLLGTVSTATADDQNWWVDLSYLFLAEHVDGEDLFVMDSNDDGIFSSSERKFNTDRLLRQWDDPDDNIGWRFEFGHLWPSGWGISFAYLGRLAESEFDFDNNNDIEPTFGASPNNNNNTDLGEFEQADEVKMSFDTSLHSIELNVLFPPWSLNECTQLRGLVGQRFILIKDDMELQSHDDVTDPDDISSLFVDTDNFLGGLQAGLGLHWQPCSWFGLFTNVNTGIYYAHIAHEIRFKEFDGDHDKWDSSESDQTLGFLGEARIAGEFRVTNNIGIRVGYMLLYLSETGRALNQIQPGDGLDEDADDTAYPSLNKDYTFYHGVMASAIIRW